MHVDQNLKGMDTDLGPCISCLIDSEVQDPGRGTKKQVLLCRLEAILVRACLTVTAHGAHVVHFVFMPA